jgi:hypothetical protein
MPLSPADTGAEVAGAFGEVGVVTLVVEELGSSDGFERPVGAAWLGDMPALDEGVVAGVMVLAAAFEPADDAADD